MAGVASPGLFSMVESESNSYEWNSPETRSLGLTIFRGRSPENLAF
jgi:hypothetical protein